jgi:hypothetical protein
MSPQNKRQNVSDKKVMADMVEFGAWHAINIYPDLNGFQGYDCVSFNFVKPKP